MSQSVFEQHQILDKIYLELKSSYQKGQIATYEHLLKVAPNLSKSDYEVLIERFKGHINQQNIQKNMAHNSRNGDLDVQLYDLQQDFFKSLSRIIGAHENKIAQKNQNIIDELKANNLVLEKELAQTKIKYDNDNHILSQEIESLKKQLHESQTQLLNMQSSVQRMGCDYEALSLLKILTKECGLETLESLPFHPNLNSVIVEIIDQVKLLSKEQFGYLSLLLNNTIKVAQGAKDLGINLSEIINNKHDQVFAEHQANLKKNSPKLSEQEQAFLALKDKFPNIEQLGADNSYFMEDDSFDSHDESLHNELLPSFKSLLDNSAHDGLSSSSFINYLNEQEHIQPSNDHEPMIEGLNAIAQDLLAKKSVSELSYSDIGQALKTALRMEIGQSSQINLMSHLLLKIIFLEDHKPDPSDFALTDEELLEQLKSDEQRKFARGLFSWLNTNFVNDDSYVNPLASLITGGHNLKNPLSSGEILNSSVPKAIPRDEGTLVREMSLEGGNDNIAAFAAASAKIASLAPLLHEAGKELKLVQKELDDDLVRNNLKDRLMSHSEESNSAQLPEDKVNNEDGPYATMEITSVAKDVVKVASELELGGDDKPNKKYSLFDNSLAASELTGTTVFGVDDNQVSSNLSSNTPKDNFIKQDDISSNNEDDSLDDFITGNITDYDQEPKKEHDSSLTDNSYLNQESTKENHRQEKESAVNSSFEDKKESHDSINNDINRYVSTSTVSATGNTAIIKTTSVDNNHHEFQNNSLDAADLANYNKGNNNNTLIKVAPISEAKPESQSVSEQQNNNPSIKQEIISNNKQETLSDKDNLTSAPKVEQETKPSEAVVSSPKVEQETKANEAVVSSPKVEQENKANEAVVSSPKVEQETKPIEAVVNVPKIEQETKANETVVSAPKVEQETKPSEPIISDTNHSRSIFDAQKEFKLKTNLDEDGKRRFKFLCDVIDQRIQERISKVNNLLLGTSEAESNLVQVKDVAWFYQSCINSLDSQGMLNDELKKALYEKMEYDLNSNIKVNKTFNKTHPIINEQVAKLDSAKTKEIQVDEHKSYDRTTTLVLPDISAITGKSTIDWDEFNSRHKDNSASNTSLEDSNNIVHFDSKSEKVIDDEQLLDPESIIKFDGDKTEDKLAQERKERLLSMFMGNLNNNKGNSSNDIGVDELIAEQIARLRQINANIKNNGFMVVDDSKYDDGSSNKEDNQDESPIIHRSVTFATLDESDDKDEDSDKLLDEDPNGLESLKSSDTSQDEDSEDELVITPANTYVKEPKKEESFSISGDFSPYQRNSFGSNLNSYYSQPKEATFMFQDANGTKEQLKTKQADEDSNGNDKP